MNRNERRLTGIYLVAEAMLLVLIMMLMLTVPESVYTKVQYPAIVLNTCVTAYFWYRHHSRSDTFAMKAIPLALVLTLCADTFLVGINNYYIVGIVFFCAVQTVYAVYLGITKKSLTARIVLFALLAVLAAKGDAELTFSAYSMANLIINAIRSWIVYRKKGRKTSDLYFAIGLLLFFGCDSCVSVRNALAGNDGLTYWIVYLGVWACYVPSQVMIVLSWLRKIEEQRKCVLRREG
jgi:hypothetical protein